MDRPSALLRLRDLIGQDLRLLAQKHGITVWQGDRKNKGWAGHTIERYLGLPLNSAQAPNFGSWELKVVPLRRLVNGEYRVKETMAITMIDPHEVVQTPFECSHLYRKLARQIVVSRLFEGVSESRSLVFAVAEFDLNNTSLFQQVKADYEAVQQKIKSEGFEALTGHMGCLVQPRTKGRGHGSTTRAFYARTQFVAHILKMTPWKEPSAIGP